MVEGFEVKDQILRVDQETLDTTSFMQMKRVYMTPSLRYVFPHIRVGVGVGGCLQKVVRGYAFDIRGVSFLSMHVYFLGWSF